MRPAVRGADEIGISDFGVVMFLQYYLNEQGDRVYTLKVRKENKNNGL